MSRMAFESIPIRKATRKPREEALTMMIDWGLPVGQQADLLGIAGNYVDLAKIAGGSSRLIEEEYLAKKIALYKKHSVSPFPGGMFLEYAVQQGVEMEYFQACKAVGYDTVEVSDNAIAFKPEAKRRIIQQAVEDYGLRVLGEVGSKHTATDARALVGDIKLCIEAGSWKVFVEAAELFCGGEFRGDILKTIADEVPVSKLLFELPGAWIPEIHAHQIHALQVYLFRHLGPTVNVANIAPDAVLSLATLRYGIVVTSPRAGAEEEQTALTS